MAMVVRRTSHGVRDWAGLAFGTSLKFQKILRVLLKGEFLKDTPTVHTLLEIFITVGPLSDHRFPVGKELVEETL